LTHSDSDRLGANWVAIERDYCARDLSIKDLCALHSVSRAQLYRRASANGWPLRRGRSRAGSKKTSAHIVEKGSCITTSSPEGEKWAACADSPSERASEVGGKASRDGGREPAAAEASTLDKAGAVSGAAQVEAVAPARAGRAKAKASVNGGARKRAGHAKKAQPDLLQRLLAALDYKMTAFENRMAQGDGAANAAEGERDARTLNTMVRLFEKLKSLQDQGDCAAGKGGRSRATAANTTGPATKFASMDTAVRDAQDAEQLRNELAERLGKLREQLGA